jgi:molecular chaperone DnaK
MKKIVLGIDWGTTNSCVSYYNSDSGKFVVIPNEQGELVSPSAIYFEGDDDVLFGSIALNMPGHLSKLKRLVGKEFIIGQKSLSTVITCFIEYLKNYAMEFIGIGIGITEIDVVITVPVYYNDNQREIIKNCFQDCKMNVIRIINEPTAAALAYAYACDDVLKEDEYVLVFDCGGGTTDISLLYLDYSNQVYEVKNVIGDNVLGGEDLTDLLKDYLGQGDDRKVKRACEKLKCDLSFKENAVFNLELGDTCINQHVSRNKFLEITKPFFKKIKDLILKLLNDTTDHVKKSLKKVIFVGGTTRIPYFKDLFKELLGNDITINCDLDPDTTVSLGAAVQGALIEDLLSGDFSDTLLLDIIPLSIGIETVGGIMTPIISRNSILPISRTQEFKTTDTHVEICIYQGERKFVKDNFLLAKFDFDGTCEINSTISITFDVSLDGIITASAKSQDNTCSIQIEKNKKTDIDNFNIETHLLDAENNKLIDSENANKIMIKNDLYESFKQLLSVFHEYSTVSVSEYIKKELNCLFNETFYIIQDFESYTPDQLRETKKIFEETWHRLIFDVEIAGTDLE